ncbi:MAG: S1C family serine protease [Pseudomonadota bacterium]
MDTTDDSMLDTLMQSVVAIKVQAVKNARTTKNFGETRTGTGVVIDTAGLIATTGDIVAEAATISVTFSDGEVSDASLVAYDHHTGLGLLRAMTATPTVAITLGDSADVKVDDIAMMIPASGEADAVALRVGKIAAYSGGWEYIINKALHTYPPSTSFSGAPLLSENAELLGIGTIISIDIDIDPKIRVPGNVFIPVNTLTSALGNLLVNGRSDIPSKPWIGLDVRKSKRGLAISAVTETGPADLAGIRSGDILVAVARQKVDSQNDFFKKVWKSFSPGDEFEIMVLRGAEYHTFPVTASDYYEWLQKPVSQTQLTELVD